MTVQSFTGTIDTNGQFATVESLTSITFTADTNYSIQVQNIADIKIADAIFTFRNEKFQYKAGTEDMYIKTYGQVVLTILENE